MQAINLFQQGTAVSSEIEAIHAYADEDTNGLFDPSVDRLLDTSASLSTYYALDSLGVSLTPKKITYLFVTYDLALTVRDSVSVNFQINGPLDLTFGSGGVNVQGEFPINSPGTDVTNGMIAEQITPVTAPPYRASPGETNVYGLGFTVPSNGALQDVLRAVTIRNVGTALPGQDITALNLWIEASGDMTFSPVSDRLAATLTWTGSGWRNPTAVSELVTTAGLRCYISADIAATAADNRTIQLSVPVNGIDVASGNDGPIDAAVTNAQQQVVSTDPLLASIAFDRGTYSIGQTVVLSMHVRNAGLTPITGVHPSTLTLQGPGVLTGASGPVPVSADLAPGEDVTFVWSYSAGGAGAVDVCGGAFDADSTEASESACAGGATLQNKASGTTVALTDVSPPGVNTAQENVALAKVAIDYSAYDSLSAGVTLDGLVLDVVDPSGARIAPNSRLAEVTLVSSTGSSFAYPSVDSVSSPMRLRLDPPINIAPGARVEVDIVTDIATGAILAPFGLGVETLSDVEVRDANDRLVITPATGNTFPWLTNSILVSSPAETLLVTSADTTSTTANVGQEATLLFAGSLLNDGPAQSANMLMTRLAMDFYDLGGAPIDAGEVIRQLSIVADGEAKFVTENFPQGSNRLTCNINSTLLLLPGTAKPFEVRVDVRSFPSHGGFYAVLQTAATTVARDANAGNIVPVDAQFPLQSRRLRFQIPATRLDVSGRTDSGETILPSAADVKLMTMTFCHPDTVEASAVSVDSIVVEFVDPLGQPLFPGDWLAAMRLVRGSETLASITTLSTTTSIVECRLTPPLTLSPGDTDSVAVVIDAKGLVAPTRFFARVDRRDLCAIDVNDGSRVLGVDGDFPLLGGPFWLRIPGANIYCSMQSRVPSNVTGHEQDLAVFDMTVDNRNEPGYTGAVLDSILVRIVDTKGRLIPAPDVLTTARLAFDDSLSVPGKVTADGVLFDFASSPLGIDAGAGISLTLRADLDVAFTNRAFRFVIEDAVSISMRDAANGDAVAPQHDGGYPMMTRPTYVLGAGVADGFTNYPNPFAAGREETHITFYLDEPSRVSLELYTLWGEHVATLLHPTSLPAGLHQDVTWNGRTADGDVVNNGVYYLVLDISSGSGGGRSLKRKVGVVR